MESYVFRLSLKSMLMWAGRYLLIGTGSALVFSLIVALPLLFFSKLPPDMWMIPFILGLIPVGLLFAFFGPMVLLLCFLYSKLIWYELNEIGITQHFAFIKNEICWLAMSGAEETTQAKLQLYSVSVLKKNRPLIIYADFLASAPEFNATVLALAPEGNPMRQLLNDEAIKTDELPQEYSALHEKI